MKRKPLIIGTCSALAVVLAVFLTWWLASYSLQDTLRRSYVTEDGASTVYGELYNENGKRIRGNADILLCGIACFSAQANLKGEFAFTHIPSGDYRLYAVHNQCKSAEQVLTIHIAEFITLANPLKTDNC